MKNRFDGRFKEIMALEGLIPAFHSKWGVGDIMKAAEIYKTDLNFISESGLRLEIELWHEHCKKKDVNSIETSIEALQFICEQGYKLFFPNISTLLQLFATLPVTSATAERSFSLLDRLKTYLRSTMGEDRLNGLALANVHKDIDVKPEQVIELFCKVKPRRLEKLDWND